MFREYGEVYEYEVDYLYYPTASTEQHHVEEVFPMHIVELTGWNLEFYKLLKNGKGIY